jgi:hypothetical protein
MSIRRRRTQRPIVFATWLALAALAVPAAVASAGSTTHIRARWLSPIAACVAAYRSQSWSAIMPEYGWNW